MTGSTTRRSRSTRSTDKSSVDANVAAAYLALAQSDLKTARSAADAALSDAPNDAAANYVAGQVALLADDLPEAIKRGKAAVDKDPRALYSVGLARIYAAATSWTEATAALSRAFAVLPDQPSAVIEHAIVLADSGQVAGRSKGDDRGPHAAREAGRRSEEVRAVTRRRSRSATSRSRNSTSHATTRTPRAPISPPRARSGSRTSGSPRKRSRRCSKGISSRRRRASRRPRSKRFRRVRGSSSSSRGIALAQGNGNDAVTALQGFRRSRKISGGACRARRSQARDR